MKINIFFAIVLTIVILVSGCIWTENLSESSLEPDSTAPDILKSSDSPVSVRGTAPSSPAPSEFKELYRELEGRLDYFDSYLNSRWDGEKSNVTWGSELLTANAHMGERMLSVTNFQSTLLWLDRYQEMGIKGVKVAIEYPVLTQGFPGYQAYLDFYKKLSAELKKRKMTMVVGALIIIPGPFSNLPCDYKGMTWDRYQTEKRYMLETIVKEIQPDYLTVSNEPTTEAMAFRLPMSVGKFTENVKYMVTGLNKGKTLLGAGTGSWSEPEYIRALVSIKELDYIDLHTYPLVYLENLLLMSDIAKNSGKKLVMAEAWLYKVGNREMDKFGALATQPEVFGRDAYSFWEPLDSKFLEVMVKFSHFKKYDFISPFWTQYFFSYLDYEKMKRVTNYAELSRLRDMEAAKNFLLNRLTGTGEHYRKLIAPDAEWIPSCGLTR